jgi:hypothetical protein
LSKEKDQNAQQKMLIRCSERGLSGTLIRFLQEKLNFHGRPYPVVQPGGIYDIMHGSTEIRKHYRKRIRTILIEASIKEVAIVGHDLCIIYNEEQGFMSLEDERKMQLSDMKELKAIINKNHPGVIVHLIYAKVLDAKRRIFSLELVEG